MKKTERLNQMMMYINDVEQFNLRDLMARYNISKSTALRDISSLEAIGLPIYAEQGRHGKYKVLKNRLLSPIVFTVDEVYALYFSMLTLQTYESTPFQLNVAQLKEKFATCLSVKQRATLQQMQDALRFEGTKHHYESPHLDTILASIVDEVSCHIEYGKKARHVQFIKLTTKFGQWYASAIEWPSEKHKVFRCDKLTKCERGESVLTVPLQTLREQEVAIYRSEKAIDFAIEIEARAKDLFYKEHYPSMTLEVGEKTVIRGFYNEGEEAFIADYVLKYGTAVVGIWPEGLRRVVGERLRKLALYFEEL